MALAGRDLVRVLYPVQLHQHRAFFDVRLGGPRLDEIKSGEGQPASKPPFRSHTRVRRIRPTLLGGGVLLVRLHPHATTPYACAHCSPAASLVATVATTFYMQAVFVRELLLSGDPSAVHDGARGFYELAFVSLPDRGLPTSAVTALMDVLEVKKRAWPKLPTEQERLQSSTTPTQDATSVPAVVQPPVPNTTGARVWKGMWADRLSR